MGKQSSSNGRHEIDMVELMGLQQLATSDLLEYGVILIWRCTTCVGTRSQLEHGAYLVVATKL